MCGAEPRVAGRLILLLLIQLIAGVGIVVAAIAGKGSRGAYFGAAGAATLFGLAFLSLISSPTDLANISAAERVGAERLNALAPIVAWIFFAAAIGGAIGGCVFRASRPATDRSQGHVGIPN